MSYPFKFPEVVQDDEDLDNQVERLKGWISANMCSNLESMLSKIEKVLNWYERTQFNGRVKANVIVFYERAKVLLIKAIYDKSKGKWHPCPD